MLHSWVKLPSVCQPRCEFFHLHISTSEALIKYITHTRSSWSQDERHSMCPSSLLEGSMCKCTVPSSGVPVGLVRILPAGLFNAIFLTRLCAKYVLICLWKLRWFILLILGNRAQLFGLLVKRCEWRRPGRWPTSEGDYTMWCKMKDTSTM